MREDEESFQKEWRGASFITAQPATEFEFEKISTINAARFQKAFAGGGTLKVIERDGNIVKCSIFHFVS